MLSIVRGQHPRKANITHEATTEYPHTLRPSNHFNLINWVCSKNYLTSFSEASYGYWFYT